MLNQKAIIFDADGVLYDGETTSHVAGHRVLRRLNPNIKISEEEMSDNLIGIRVNAQQEFLKDFFKKRGEKIIFPENYIKELDSEQMRFFEEEPFPPIGGIINVLEMLQSKRVPFFIGSRSRIHTMKKKIDKSGLGKYFPEEHVYYPERLTSDDWSQIIKYSRNLSISPDKIRQDKAGVFLSIALINGFKPENCLVLEDTISGLESAKAVNMKTLGVALTKSSRPHLKNVTDHKVCKSGEEIVSSIEQFLF